MRNPGSDRVREAFTRAWLTTVVTQVCTDMLRARALARYGAAGLDCADANIRDPELDTDFSADQSPADKAEARALGIAVLVALDHLPPEERLPFVMYDLMAVPGDDISRALDRSPDAVRDLAARARARIRARAPRALRPARGGPPG